MTIDVLTADNVSVERLQGIFEAAYLDYEILANEELRVQEKIRIRVRFSQERRAITLYAGYGFKAETTREQRIEAANRINAEYLIVRCSVVEQSLWFEYDFMLDGGLAPKALVLGLRRFAGIPPSAVDKHAAELIE